MTHQTKEMLRYGKNVGLIAGQAAMRSTKVARD
jgi:hypothetical protein